MAAMGQLMDYPRLADEVLGIRGASPTLARQLVDQALVMEDRQEFWQRAGERICRDAPTSPGIYVLRDTDGEAVYVGKALNLRRRLRSHFSARRWRALRPVMARVTGAEWQEVGSELEALLREAILIRQLRPKGNVQIGPPAIRTRVIPRRLMRDVVTIVPSVNADSVELVAARVEGDILIQRISRDGGDLDRGAADLWQFFHPARLGTQDEQGSLAALVFSWLAGRGANTTRLDPHDWESASALAARLGALLRDETLFVERLVIV
jgi:predicted GIY-YIG superfamily endonuclease